MRAFVPVGMMAAPVADGWLFQLCPSGMSSLSYMALLGQSHHADHASHTSHASHAGHADHAQHESADADPACALNPGFVALSDDTAPQLLAVRASRTVLKPQQKVQLPRAPPTANRSRAPPFYS